MSVSTGQSVQFVVSWYVEGQNFGIRETAKSICDQLHRFSGRPMCCARVSGETEQLHFVVDCRLYGRLPASYGRIPRGSSWSCAAPTLVGVDVHVSDDHYSQLTAGWSVLCCHDYID
jgi:hypothetical protein